MIVLMILSTIFVIKCTDCKSILSNSDSTNCYMDYLKSHGSFENNLKNDKIFHVLSKECESMTNDAIHLIYSKYVNHYEGSENITKCVVENMKIINWAEDTFKLQLYEKFYQVKLEKWFTNQMETEEYFWGICASGFNFTAAFDGLLDRSPSFSNEETQCIEKYFAKKDSKYRKHKKPESTIDCKSVVNTNLLVPENNLKSEMMLRTPKFTPEEIECILKAHRKNKFFERNLKLDYMKGLGGIIDEQKLKEQKQYLKMMKKVATMAEKCYENKNIE